MFSSCKLNNSAAFRFKITKPNTKNCNFANYQIFKESRILKSFDKIILVKTKTTPTQYFFIPPTVL